MTSVKVPDVEGYRFFRYGEITEDDIGKYVQKEDGSMEEIRIAHPFRYRYVIYQKERRYRDPTIDDIGKAVWVRDNGSGLWCKRVFAGKSAHGWCTYVEEDKSCMWISTWDYARVEE